MTPILLSSLNTKIAFLKDSLRCEVTEERNGIYECVLEYPVAGRDFAEISAGRYIKASPNSTADPQLFKIYSVSKPIMGTVTVNCEHVSYALSRYPIKSIAKGKTTALVAMNKILSAANEHTENAYNFSAEYCDIDTVTNFGADCCSARAALGGIDGSVLDCFGGEYEFDNLKIKLHKARGKDNGITIRYGKNMTEMKLTISVESSYTGIFPYAINDDQYVYLSEIVQHVENKTGIEERILFMDFSGYFENEEEKNEANLRKHVTEYLNNNDINAVDGSMTVSMIDLSKTAHARLVPSLETVSLCDTVKVINSLMNVTVSMKVIKTVYDSLGEKYVSLELGTPRADFADVIKQTQRTANEALRKASEVPDTSALEQKFRDELDNMTKKITGASGGHVVLNPSKNPQELLLLCDSDKLETAKKLYRWNSAGLSYSPNGYNGPYTAAFLGDDGKLIINNVTARSISASLIKAGVITSEDASMLIDLDNGKIATNKNGFSTIISTGRYRLKYGQNICTVSQYVGFKLNDTSETLTESGMSFTAETSSGIEPGFKFFAHKGDSGGEIASFNQAKANFSVPITIGAESPTGTWRGFTVYRKVSNNVYNVTYCLGSPAGKPAIATELKNSNGTVLVRLNVSGTVGTAAGSIWLNNNYGGSAIESKKLIFGTSELTWGGSTVTVSSLAENKTNIQGSSTVLPLFESSKSQIYSYDFLAEPCSSEASLNTASVSESNIASEKSNKTFGFVIGDGYNTPPEVLSSDGKHISLYSMAAITWKAVQELLEKNKTLESKILSMERNVAS
jgi:phage minor structural protein